VLVKVALVCENSELYSPAEDNKIKIEKINREKVDQVILSSLN
jgi:hypothetical protein